jgi:hypothetical protein
VDSAARWFLAGILVSLVNTALVIAFIGIPGITDDDDSDGDPVVVTETEIVEVEVPVTYILVVDDEGNVIREEVRVGRPGDNDTPVTTPTATATPVSDELTFGAPRFVSIANPIQVAARKSLALVATGEFGLTAVGLSGGAIAIRLDGLTDTGRSAVIDVDIAFDGTIFILLRDSDLEWRIASRRAPGAPWAVIASDVMHRWPASVNAMTAAATGTLYLSSTSPAGLVELDLKTNTVTPVVEGRVVRGVDAGFVGTRVVYAAPAVQAVEPPEQIGLFEDRIAGAYETSYRRCPGPVARRVPAFPPDVALVSADRVLVVDGGNHGVRLQERDGEGELIFGHSDCTAASDESGLRSPSAVAIDLDFNVFIADLGNNRLVILPQGGDDPADAGGNEDTSAP